jgi:hypothetical protein
MTGAASTCSPPMIHRFWEHLNRGPVKYRIRIRRVAPAHVLDTLVATRPEELLREIHNMWGRTPDV